jgi:hypothetical protein
MGSQLNFDIQHQYPLNEAGITIETILSRGEKRFLAEAKIDTGAHLCLFERQIGEYLEIEIENGKNNDDAGGRLSRFWS